MINKDVLVEYARIVYGCKADSNFTLVDFSFSDEDRKVVNLVNNEAKKDKKLAKLLDDLKYSNNKSSVINEYFGNVGKTKEVRNYRQERIDSYGFINLSNLGLIVGFVTLALAVVVTICG